MLDTFSIVLFLILLGIAVIIVYLYEKGKKMAEKNIKEQSEMNDIYASLDDLEDFYKKSDPKTYKKIRKIREKGSDDGKWMKDQHWDRNVWINRYKVKE